jgi:flavodoxin
MNVAVVYFGDETVSQLADDLAREARTHAMTPHDYDFCDEVDLLMIGCQCLMSGHKHKKEIHDFISHLDPSKIKNVAVFSLFTFKNGLLNYTVKEIVDHDLPLLRDQYECKIPMRSEITDNMLQGARVYVDDMMTVVNNYY